MGRALKEAEEDCLNVLRVAGSISQEIFNSKDAIGKRVSTLAIAKMLIDLMRER